ncbi:hypothetical protein D3C86_1825820 [compost metagenome]
MQALDRRALYRRRFPLRFTDNFPNHGRCDLVDREQGQVRHPVNVEGYPVVFPGAPHHFPTVEPGLRVFTEQRRRGIGGVGRVRKQLGVTLVVHHAVLDQARYCRAKIGGRFNSFWRLGIGEGLAAPELPGEANPD